MSDTRPARPVRSPTLVVLALFVVASALFPGAPRVAAAAAPSEVPDLVQSLADADPARRAAAADRLVQIGRAARDGVLAATVSPDPEIAFRAADVLMKLPWDRAGDSPLAREALTHYGNGPEPERKQVVVRLADSSETGVLLRLLIEEPSNNVRWFIVAALLRDATEATAERLRKLPTDRDNAPALVAAARGWLATDPAKAMDLYRRAVELERSRPSDDLGIMRLVFAALLTDAFAHRDLETVAGLLRKQAERAFAQDPPDAAIAQLFVLHAYHGPLSGYANDLRTYGGVLGRPVFLDEVYLLMSGLGVSGTRPLARLAYQTLDLDPATRHAATRFLMFFGRNGDAEGELMTVLASPNLDPDVEIDARYRLASLAMDREDDAAVAAELTVVMDLMEKHDKRFTDRDPKDVWGEIHWRSFRAARAAGNDAEAAKHLEELVNAPPAHADVILDIVEVLAKQGRQADADKVFDAAYDELKTRVEKEPAEVNHANNLAWMLSRSGKRIDEAVALSRRAITVEPNNPAYLDTAAEAQFRAGDVEEAIRLETRALELRPDDKFMRSQLDRFRAARSLAKPKKPAAHEPG
jgi:tetratricopeptide (TPR) repeat protein